MTEGSHNIIKTRTIHKKEPYPFGLEHGLMTDLGIISGFYVLVDHSAINYDKTN